eukprot:TRINITY_DN16003_c0_g1_i1.p1 TRINITY_DN16003_c0_g1~~TRINITY_DN16003_c0_g1_i1.p1  ORF type:complete len:194 (+),score=24.11 TRINITY_DN16003_c0_g1_i1:70-651(+)
MAQVEAHAHSTQGLSSSDSKLLITLSQICNHENGEHKSQDIPVSSSSFIEHPLGRIAEFGYTIAQYFLYWSDEIAWTSDIQNAIKHEVIKTNWYWREQTRFLLFEEKHLLRLRSNYLDVRAAHKYTSIKDVKICGPGQHFQISFNDGSPTEFYQSQERENIIQKILKKSELLGHTVDLVSEDEYSNQTQPDPM